MKHIKSTKDGLVEKSTGRKIVSPLDSILYIQYRYWDAIRSSLSEIKKSHGRKISGLLQRALRFYKLPLRLTVHSDGVVVLDTKR